jgi:hypothetical protein
MVIKIGSYIITSIFMTIEKPSSWLLIGYDVPSKPSRLKVRLWRYIFYGDANDDDYYMTTVLHLSHLHGQIVSVC